jgi:hypothetical protein
MRTYGWRAALAAQSLITTMGCATRSTPVVAPPGAAVRSDAGEGYTASVTRALEADPPLPGEDRPGWAGLQGPSPATDPEHEVPASHHPGSHHHGP